MKRIIALLAILILLGSLFGLTGCEADEPIDTTVPTVETTAPTEPAPTLSAADRYAESLKKLDMNPSLVLTYTYTLTRTVAGETFTEKRVGTASYAGLQSTDMSALINEELTYGTYSTRYYQSYLSGSAYCRVNNSSFACPMTSSQFRAQQLPAALMDEALYGSVTSETAEDGTTFTFREPTMMESWVSHHDSAQWTAAYGTARLNAEDKLVSSTYHAEYTVGSADYVLEVSMEVAAPSNLDFSAEQPVYPENCPQISDLSIPRYLLQVVGDVYTADAITVTCTDTVYSEVFSTIRNQNSSFNTFGSGDDFMAAINTQVTVKDYTGIPTVNSQSILFRDGVYSYSINGGEPVTDPATTADTVRTGCEDSILSSLMGMGAIAGAEIQDHGDLIYIRFTGTKEFADGLCASIYNLFTMNLDSYAASYTTDDISGYLTINKYTGLATAMGLSLSRHHVIDNVSYALTYQLDQAVMLPSMEAQENITGNAPESDPSETIAPLFYKITNADGKTLWLLGSLPVGDSSTAALPKALMDAFETADALVVAYDPNSFAQQLAADPVLQAQLADAYYYSNHASTQSHLSEALYSKAYPLLLATGCNSINTPYMRVVLWENLISDLYLQQSYSLSPRYGIENQLLTLAAGLEKPVYEIETGLSHLQLVAKFSDPLQSWLLERLLADGLLGTQAKNEATYEAWCKGDAETLTGLLKPDTTAFSEEELALYNEYYKALYTDHDKSLLTTIRNHLSGEETVFLCVEVSHLLGEDGLAALLAAEGYTVEAVTYQ